MADKTYSKIYTVSSGYNPDQRRGFIQIEGPKFATISIDEARQLGINLLRAAEGAETDAFLFQFITDTLKGDQHMAAGLLIEFREWRQAAMQEKYGHAPGNFPQPKDQPK